MLKTIVADDHPMFREALTHQLANAFPVEIVGEADTYAVLQTHLDKHPSPDLLVLDLIFPGFEVTRHFSELRSTLPATAIVVVSMVEENDVIERVIAEGASGFISKSTPRDGMIEAFQTILAGGSAVVRTEPEMLTTPASPDLTEVLSARQIDVLRLICEGRSNKEIAKVLAISPYTVRIHVSSLLQALNVPTRAAAAAIGAKAQLG